MLKPTSNFMIIEKYKTTSITVPDNIQSQKGDLFKVLAVGPGWITERGIRVTPDIKVGDVVAMYGKILTVPYQHKEFQIARTDDVIAYERLDLGIPDKI
ncbi:MAG TPA: co-chaperone GroES [Candidatus Scalindua sp.]|nr:co-chaperone GroES [Candidatus Scalindua sp.]